MSKTNRPYENLMNVLRKIEQIENVKKLDRKQTERERKGITCSLGERVPL